VYDDGNIVRHGKTEARQLDEPLFALVPDHWRRFDKMIVAGDTVAIWGTFGATAPSGKAFEVEVCDIIEVRDGRMQSMRMIADWSPITDALGGTD
jgi:ketosteroid isomerase-like protein